MTSASDYRSKVLSLLPQLQALDAVDRCAAVLWWAVENASRRAHRTAWRSDGNELDPDADEDDEDDEEDEEDSDEDEDDDGFVEHDEDVDREASGAEAAPSLQVRCADCVFSSGLLIPSDGSSRAQARPRPLRL